MSTSESERIGELLIEEGIVTKEELRHALAEGGIQGTHLAELLDASPHAGRSELAAFLASDYRVPTLNDLRKVGLREDAVRMVPADLARRHELVPLVRAGNVLFVAKANYYNRAAVRELREVTHLKVKVIQADESQVRAAIEYLYGGRHGTVPPPGEKAVPPAPGVATVEPLDVAHAVAPAAPQSSVSPVETLEDVTEILEAVPIGAQEYASVARDPFVRVIMDFDAVFRSGRPVHPQKVG